MRPIIFVLFILFLGSCVPKSNYDKLKLEYNKLKSENDSLKTSLKSQNNKGNRKRVKQAQTSSKLYSDEDALEFVKDYYDFYNANYKYRNARVRRISNNEFLISLEECDKDLTSNESFWNARVRTLTIKDDGTYHIQ